MYESVLMILIRILHKREHTHDNILNQAKTMHCQSFDLETEGQGEEEKFDLRYSI